MLAWLAANIGTILVTFVLLAVVAAVIRTMLRDRRQGKNACGVRCGDCSGCAGCAGCAGARRCG